MISLLNELPRSIRSQHGEQFYLTIRRNKEGQYCAGYMVHEGWLCMRQADYVEDAIRFLALHINGQKEIDKGNYELLKV